MNAAPVASMRQPAPFFRETGIDAFVESCAKRGVG